MRDPRAEVVEAVGMLCRPGSHRRYNDSALKWSVTKIEMYPNKWHIAVIATNFLVRFSWNHATNWGHLLRTVVNLV